ncbi:hypothetical protein [Flavobacterium sp.]|uniref:hypothetical protein n=1 Tax=Flavobacterium sp. TaxID=239 RepID=UPI0025BE44CB|nr:hypothetical protein [Flavobacterium sp.]MBA4153530.1 hypothetical protein [Flavobacterium sp.]
MKKFKYFLVNCALFLSIASVFGQEKEAVITLSFEKVDSVNVCKALVTSEGKPVQEVSVGLFVKRLYSNLAIGEPIATDSIGEASFEVPQDIPSPDGKLVFIAKIEDDENYMNTETKSEIKWGMIIASDNSNVGERSISGGRDKAPIYFIVASLLAIGIVWGTLFYAVFQIFRIRKLRTINKD